MSYADLLTQSPKLNRTNSDRLISPPLSQNRNSLTPESKHPTSRLSSSSCQIPVVSLTPNRQMSESKFPFNRKLRFSHSGCCQKLFQNNSKDIPLSPRRNNSNGRLNDLQSQYSSNNSPKKRKRVLPTKPTSIFHIPNIPTNFYVSPIDWSKNDIIAIATTSALEFINPRTNDVFLPSPPLKASSLKYNSTGDSLALGFEDGHLEILDIPSLYTYTNFEVFPQCPLLVSDWNDNIIVSGYRNGSMSIIDIRTENPIISKNIHSDDICCVKFCDRSTSTTTAIKHSSLKSSSTLSLDSSISLNSSIDLVESNSQLSQTSSISLTNSSTIIATSGNDCFVKLWDLRKLDTPTLSFNQHTAAVKAIQFSPTIPNVIATGGGTSDKSIKIWNYLTGELLNSVNSGSQVCNLFWNEEYNEIFSTHGFSQNHLALWRGNDLSPIASFQTHKQRVLFMAASPDSTRVATVSSPDGVLIWTMFPSNRLSLTQSMKFLR